jgi:hypothetical protein
MCSTALALSQAQADIARLNGQLAGLQHPPSDKLRAQPQGDHHALR